MKVESGQSGRFLCEECNSKFWSNPQDSANTRNNNHNLAKKKKIK